MNDTFALDLGRSGDKDKDMPVYPVAPGEIVENDNTMGFILIKHEVPLVLDNGEVLAQWYSGYMHMRSKTSATFVDKDTSIGRISNTGLGANGDNHLHFALYSGDHTSLNQMVSLDLPNKLTKFNDYIAGWYKLCPGSTNEGYQARHWWSVGQTPCP